MMKNSKIKTICFAFAVVGISTGISIPVDKQGGVSKSTIMSRSRTFSEHDSRFSQIVNYDDQVADGTSNWTKDYEYVRHSEGGKFHPNSPIHVPEKEAVQEQYNGIHQAENELFRVGEKSNEKDSGIRVSSGLSLDQRQSQHQSSNPNPERSTAGTVPLCRFYKNPLGTLEEWEGAEKWVMTSELGVKRLTIRDLLPTSDPTTVFLRGHACNAATISANINADSDTIAGVVFRAESDANKLAVLLDTSRRVVTLSRFREGKQSTISEIFVSYLHPEMRHRVEIVDHGASGNVTVYLDGRSVFSQPMPFTGIGSMGVLIQRGHASFDSFTLSP